MKRTKDAHTVFDNFAAQYAAKFMDLTPFHSSFDLFCETIAQKGATIFEMACGPGNITKYLLSKRSDFQLLGSDVSPQMLVLAQANNPKAAFQNLDCRDISTLGKKYDGVVSGFVLPYLNSVEVEKLFVDTFNLLRPSGVFYLSTMVDTSTYSKYVGPSSGEGPALLTHYYEVDFLKQRLAQSGFEIVASDFVSSPHYEKSCIRDWWVIASRNS